jgi:ATP-grasp domain
VPERVVADAEAAVAAAEAFGGPVVVKTAAAGAHKSDSGGVALDLTSADEVRAAATRIGGPLLVQPMVSGGTEVLAGVVQDPVFGPLVAFGPGGVLAELIGEAGFRIAPLTDVDAEELVDGPPVLRAALAQATHDAAALRDVVLRLAALADAVPELAEAELDPVLVGASGVLVGGARVRLAPPPARDRAKTW